MSLAPDIFTMPIIGEFLALAMFVVIILIVLKFTDLSLNVKSIARYRTAPIEFVFSVAKFVILIAPASVLIVALLQGEIISIADWVILMFSLLAVWGMLKIVVDFVLDYYRARGGGK